MRVVIDTCSLLSLARYYLPFDKDLVLYNIIKQRILRKEIIIVDKVYEECKYVSDGLVSKSLNFFLDKNFKRKAQMPYDTSLLVAPNPKELLHKVDEVYARKAIIRQKGLTPTQYEEKKYKFLRDADMTQVILCLRYKDEGVPVTLITEETERNNDNKPFVKIPVICKDLQITTTSLPKYVIQAGGIDFSFHKNAPDSFENPED